MKSIHLYAIAVTVALAGVTAVRGDLIVQKDGSVMEGKVISRDAKGLSVQMDAPPSAPSGGSATAPAGAKAGPTVQVAADAVARVVVIDEKGAEVLEGAGMGVPGKRTEKSWTPPKEPEAPPMAAAPGGATYYVIPLHGAVGETFVADALEKSLADASKRKPTVVVLDIDSPGGLVNEAELMMKTLHKYNKELRIVALVDQDLSAAAITTLSAKAIYVKSTATIGAATAYNGSVAGMPQDIEEKMQSVWRAVARNSAEEGGHDPLLAEAMIDSSKDLHLDYVGGRKVVKEGPGTKMLVTKGKILTLTSHEAVDCGLAAAIVDDVDELGVEMKFKGWKECPGLGTVLAKYLPERREAFIEKAKELEAALKENLTAAESTAPTEEIITQRIVTGGSQIGPGGPAIGGPRGGARGGGFVPPAAGGLAGGRGAAGRGAGGARGIQQPQIGPPQTVVTQQRLGVSPEQRAQWKNHSLATVISMQKMEQNIQDEISLASAFGQKGLAEELKEPLTTIGDARARIYAERNKYAGESAPAAPPVAGGGPARGPAATDTKAAGSTASNAPALALKNAALSARFSGELKQAIDKKAYKAGAIVSGSFGRDAFDDLASDGGVLIGLRCGMGKFANKDVIVSVQPVFLTSKGVVMGTLHGNPNASPVTDLVARDGYVVGGAKIGGTPSPEGLSLRFVRLTDGRLNTADSYESETIGKLDAPTLQSSTMPVIGISGKANTSNSLGLGLVSLNMPEPKPMSEMPAAKGPAVPLGAEFAGVVKDAVAKKTYEPSGTVGSNAARTAFEELAPDGGLLIGLQVGKGRASASASVTVVSIQAIFLTTKGEVLGKMHGSAAGATVEEVKAPPGYAVGGISINAGTALDGVTVTFMKIDKRTLMQDQAYKSDRVGGTGTSRGTSFGGDGTPVIGINGKESDPGRIALGLVFLTPTEKSKATREALPGRGP